jgi:hypothetical protein
LRASYGQDDATADELRKEIMRHQDVLVDGGDLSAFLVPKRIANTVSVSDERGGEQRKPRLKPPYPC